MPLNYTLRDAERWAEFSGDYNPIHFDAAEAKRLGMDGLCVHGMRAMLDVKSGLSCALEKHALSSAGLLFSCRLRDPIVCETPYQLSLSETQVGDLQQVSGKLLNPQTRQIGISSKLAETKAMELSPVTQASTLHGETLTALFAQFHAVKNIPTPLWSFFDAVLFRQLVRAPETLESVHGILSGHKVACLEEIFRRVSVVQTHHETHFSPQLLRHEEEDPQFKSLHYSIQPTLVMGKKEAGLVFVAGIQAWRFDEPLIVVTVTLKIGPLAY